MANIEGNNSLSPDSGRDNLSTSPNSGLQSNGISINDNVDYQNIANENSNLRDKCQTLETKNITLGMEKKNLEEEKIKIEKELEDSGMKIKELQQIEDKINVAIKNGISEELEKCFEEKFEKYHDKHDKIYIIGSKQSKFAFNCIVWIIAILAVIILLSTVGKFLLKVI